MKYRLLVELDVLIQLQAMPKRRRAELVSLFRLLREAPDFYSRFPEYEPGGRRLEVCIWKSFAVRYWIDFPDRHVKVLFIAEEKR